MVKDNSVGVNRLKLPRKTTEEQEIFFRKFLDFSSFLLKNHLIHFLIYTTVFLRFQVIRKKEIKRVVKKTFAECKSTGVKKMLLRAVNSYIGLRERRILNI